MTKCRAYYDFLERNRDNWEKLDGFCPDERKLAEDLRYVDFCEKHNLGYGDVSGKALQPLMRLEKKDPVAFEKAITQVRKEAHDKQKVTKNKALGIIRVAKGLPEKTPARDGSTSVYISNDDIEEVAALLPITGYPSMAAFTRAAVKAFIATQKKIYNL